MDYETPTHPEIEQLASYVLSHGEELELRKNSNCHWQVLWREPRKVLVDVWPTTKRYRCFNAKPGEKARRAGSPQDYVNAAVAVRAAMRPAASNGQAEQNEDVRSVDEGVYLVALHALLLRVDRLDAAAICRMARCVAVETARIME